MLVIKVDGEDLDVIIKEGIKTKIGMDNAKIASGHEMGMLLCYYELGLQDCNVPLGLFFDVFDRIVNSNAS